MNDDNADPERIDPERIAPERIGPEPIDPESIDPGNDSLRARPGLQLSNELAAAVAESMASLVADDEWDLPARLYHLHMVGSRPGDAASASGSPMDVLTRGMSDGDALAFIDLGSVRWLDGHPFDALIGTVATSGMAGAVLVMEGWARALSGSQTSREEVRIVTVILASGACGTRITSRQGRLLPSGATAGRVPDAVRRYLGLPTTANPPDILEVRTRALLAALIDATERGDESLLRRARIDWTVLFSELPPPLCYLDRPTWADARRAALGDPFWSALAGWADDALWASEMDDQVPASIAVAHRLGVFEATQPSRASDQLDDDIRNLLDQLLS